MNRGGISTFTLGGVGARQRGKWGEWRAHTSHFASDHDMGFSIRNETQATYPRVTRSGVAAAQAQNWWGKAVTVESTKIFQN